MCQRHLSKTPIYIKRDEVMCDRDKRHVMCDRDKRRVKMSRDDA